MSEQWTDTDVELVARLMWPLEWGNAGTWQEFATRHPGRAEMAGELLEAMAIAGWAPLYRVYGYHIENIPGVIPPEDVTLIYRGGGRLVPEEVTTGEPAGATVLGNEGRRVPYEDPQHVLDDIAQYERDEDVEKLGDLTRRLLADLEQARGR